MRDILKKYFYRTSQSIRTVDVDGVTTEPSYTYKWAKFKWQWPGENRRGWGIIVMQDMFMGQSLPRHFLSLIREKICIMRYKEHSWVNPGVCQRCGKF